MPVPVLWAYTRIMADIKVVNVLSMGAGRPYQRTCSIPQGCPFSMSILALMTYPWIKLIREQTATIPRALADDLSIWARSVAPNADQHPLFDWQEDWRHAVGLTLQYLHDMGALTATSKSLLLGTSAALRKWLRHQKWGPQQKAIPVVGHSRDLGAFYNSTDQRLGGVTITRMRHGSMDATKLGKLPRPLAATTHDSIQSSCQSSLRSRGDRAQG